MKQDSKEELRRSSELDVVGNSAKVKEKPRHFYNYIANIIYHRRFNAIILVTVVFNALCIALETEYYLRHKYFLFFAVANDFFAAFYTMEFLMKVYVEPRLYWKNRYNIFDAVLLVVSFIPLFLPEEGISDPRHKPAVSVSFIRTCSVLRVLKIVPVLRGVEASAIAVYRTLKTGVNVLFLMGLVIYIFALNGYYYLSDPTSGDTKNWGDLGSAFYSLFSIVTLDGWTDLELELEEHGMVNSRIFMVMFIAICYFVLYNMFVGVVIKEMQHSAKHYNTETRTEREMVVTQRKESITERQKKDIQELIKTQPGNQRSFMKMVEKIKKSLRHSDCMLMENLCTSMSFVDVYLTALDQQDITINQLEQLYSEAMLLLCELLEKDLSDMEHKAQEGKSK
ncbi:hypothetical protein UPYG_G00127380 [Umbra pygmaea]|uniref:Ion transport domain-containing protein n=1 Tax=Umbra pygmaea TaxID=75934 RepID=A0ABD0XNH9_UMBPY